MKKAINFLLTLSLMGSTSFIHSEERSLPAKWKKPFIITATAIGIGYLLVWNLYKKLLPGVVLERENKMKILRTLMREADYLQMRRDAIVIPPEDNQQRLAAEIEKIQQMICHPEALGYVPADEYRDTLIDSMFVSAKERVHARHIVENESYRGRLEGNEFTDIAAEQEIKDLCDDIGLVMSESEKVLKKLEGCYVVLGWKTVIDAIKNLSSSSSESDKKYQEARDEFIHKKVLDDKQEINRIKAYRGTDYYGDLDLGSDAPQQDIKIKAKRLLVQLHPDKNGDEDKYCKVNNAYMVLSDPAQRKIYDAVLKDQSLTDSKRQVIKVNIRGLLEHSQASL